MIGLIGPFALNPVRVVPKAESGSAIVPFHPVRVADAQVLPYK